MHRRIPLALMTLTFTLAACGGNSPLPSADPAATTGTLNGVRVVDANTYEFGFTPLNGTELVAKATLTAATVTQLSAGTATASVCGNVVGQDVITATVSLDSTGSMSSNDPAKLRQTAAKAFVNRMGAADRAAILSFDSSTPPTGALLASKLWQDFSSDKALLNAAIDLATFQSGSTPLYDAMFDASTLLAATGSSNSKALILTDGLDTGGDKTPAEVIAEAKKNGTPLYVIGLDSRDTLNFRTAEDIAAQTGGLFQKASNPDQLEKFFDNVYNAFRAQGCIALNFTQKPATGTEVTGILGVTVSATDKKDSKIEVPFKLQVR